MKKTITISGGFHNARGINIRIDSEGLDQVISGKDKLWMVLDKLSPHQLVKVGKHMCGISGCTCGPQHGWLVD